MAATRHENFYYSINGSTKIFVTLMKFDFCLARRMFARKHSGRCMEFRDLRFLKRRKISSEHCNLLELDAQLWHLLYWLHVHLESKCGESQVDTINNVPMHWRYVYFARFGWTKSSQVTYRRTKVATFLEEESGWGSLRGEKFSLEKFY